MNTENEWNQSRSGQANKIKVIVKKIMIIKKYSLCQLPIFRGGEHLICRFHKSGRCGVLHHVAVTPIIKSAPRFITLWTHPYHCKASSYPHHQPQTRHTLRHELPAHDQTRSAVSIPRSSTPEPPHIHPPTLSSAITGGKDNEGYLPLLVSIALFKV